MQVLGYARIERLYDVIQYCSGWQHGGGTYWASQLHTECGCEFRTAWKVGSMTRIDEGEAYTCPRCGKWLARRTSGRSWGRQTFCKVYKKQIVPTDMQFRVIAYKNYVDLEIKYHAARCTGEHTLISVQALPMLNTFTVRADIGRQVLQLISKGRDLNDDERYVKDVDPVYGPDWPLDTPLRHLGQESSAVQERRTVVQLFTLWRHEVEKRLAKKLGYAVPSLYAGTSLTSGYGLLFSPLQNVAWRLAAPTSPNYERQLWHGVAIPAVQEAFQGVLEQTRRGREYTTALCDVFRLPQKASIRKALRHQGVFSVVLFAAARRITGDVNHILRLAPQLGNVSATRYARPQLWGNDEALRFLHILAARRGMQAVYAILRQRDLWDTVGMYYQLRRENRKQVWEGRRVKMRDMHDMVMTLLDRQNFVDRPIEITSTMAALQQRVGPYDFYTPDTTYQLADISRVLHNCVKSYADRAVRHDCIIVGVRFGGKIFACIEVRDGEIKQAKLQYNQRARADEAFSRALGVWARRHRLKPCAYDMLPELAEAV